MPAWQGRCRKPQSDPATWPQGLVSVLPLAASCAGRPKPLLSAWLAANQNPHEGSTRTKHAIGAQHQDERGLFKLKLLAVNTALMPQHALLLFERRNEWLGYRAVVNCQSPPAMQLQPRNIRSELQCLLKMAQTTFTAWQLALGRASSKLKERTAPTRPEQSQLVPAWPLKVRTYRVVGFHVCGLWPQPKDSIWSRSVIPGPLHEDRTSTCRDVLEEAWLALTRHSPTDRCIATSGAAKRH